MSPRSRQRKRLRQSRQATLFDDVIDSVQSEKPDENQVHRHSEIHDPGRNQQEHSGGQGSDWQKRLGRIEVHPCLIADSEPSPRGTPVLAPALSCCHSISWINIAVVIARDQTGSLAIQGMRGLPGARFLTLPCRGSMDWHFCPLVYLSACCVSLSTSRASRRAAPRCQPGRAGFHEIKHDDYRLIFQREGTRVGLLTPRRYD